MNFKINEDLAEETGIHVGDGSMNIYTGSHLYTVACHKKDDKDYMDKVVLPLIYKIYGKTPKPRFWSQGTYGFRICSKDIVTFKHEVLELPLGKKLNVSIPKIIIKDQSLARKFMKGLFDTDGSLALWKTNRKLYPRICLSNISKELVTEVKGFLLEEGFKVTYWKVNPKNKNWNTTYQLAINGLKMLKKWADEIGFSNPKNNRKLSILKINT